MDSVVVVAFAASVAFAVADYTSSEAPFEEEAYHRACFALEAAVVECILLLLLLLASFAVVGIAVAAYLLP